MSPNWQLDRAFSGSWRPYAVANSLTKRYGCRETGERFPLSLGERAGVRASFPFNCIVSAKGWTPNAGPLPACYNEVNFH